jgi:mannose-6-phosphate isomerase-like protein (cupin superfamily)
MPAKRIVDHVGSRPDKVFKSTLFESSRLLLGLNCLEAGQAQPVHDHAHADKFYAIQAGIGDFVVGAESFRAGPGEVVWTPAGVPHGVSNSGPERLVLLVGITQSPPPDAGPAHR